MKIQLEHLAPYLPYGLKVKIPVVNKKTCRQYVIGTVGAMYSDASICCYDTVNAYPDWFKPILRPISQIDEEIEIDGKFFTPMLEIELDLKRKGEWIVQYEQLVDYLTLCPEMERIPYPLIQYLLSWHFDVFGLIDKRLAITHS